MLPRSAAMDIPLRSRHPRAVYFTCQNAAPFCPGCAPLPRRIFQLVWGRGEPIIVRGLCGEMGWTPEGMGRVCKELNK